MWVIKRDLRDELREMIQLEERRLQAEEHLLPLKLKLKEQRTSSNTGKSERPANDDAAFPAVIHSCTPHKLFTLFNDMRDYLDAYL